MTPKEVGERLGLSEQVITTLEESGEITEYIPGDIYAALSYLYEVSYSYLVDGVYSSDDDVIKVEDIMTFIAYNTAISWSAKGLLFHIWKNESYNPTLNTLEQFAGGDHEQTKSGLNELERNRMIFKFMRLIICMCVIASGSVSHGGTSYISCQMHLYRKKANFH